MVELFYPQNPDSIDNPSLNNLHSTFPVAVSSEFYQSNIVTWGGSEPIIFMDNETVNIEILFGFFFNFVVCIANTNIVLILLPLKN